MTNWRLLLTAMLFFFLGGIAVLAFARKSFWMPIAPVGGGSPSWVEIAWPFPIDEWGRGKAFRCSASECGAEVRVYLRPKIGFCNCTSGVTDDDELDRISDFGLMGDGIVPVSAGNPIQVGSMQGRSRTYHIRQLGNDHLALSTAFNNKCDVVVGTAIADHKNVVALQTLTLGFLNSDQVLGWANNELGL